MLSREATCAGVYSASGSISIIAVSPWWKPPAAGPTGGCSLQRFAVEDRNDGEIQAGFDLHLARPKVSACMKRRATPVHVLRPRTGEFVYPAHVRPRVGEAATRATSADGRTGERGHS